jgi:hypothetical protein
MPRPISIQAFWHPPKRARVAPEKPVSLSARQVRLTGGNFRGQPSAVPFHTILLPSRRDLTNDFISNDFDVKPIASLWTKPPQGCNTRRQELSRVSTRVLVLILFLKEASMTGDSTEHDQTPLSRESSSGERVLWDAE